MRSTDLPTGTRVALLRLAEEVAGLDADVGDEDLAQELAAAVDALAHGLIDLADGSGHATTGVDPGPAPPRGGTRRSPVLSADLASCSALAARLREVQAALPVAGDPPPPLAQAVVSATEVLSTAMQAFVQDLGPLARGAADDRPARTRAEHRLRRAVRRAHILVRPPEQPGVGVHRTVRS